MAEATQTSRQNGQVTSSLTAWRTGPSRTSSLTSLPPVDSSKRVTGARMGLVTASLDSSRLSVGGDRHDEEITRGGPTGHRNASVSDDDGEDRNRCRVHATKSEVAAER